ncbi:MAG: SRPBCC family protein [Chitinophagales bacterium]|nr:SRPBCC family protein [Chitinophagales bacterium]
MPTIKLQTIINAPVQQVFDLSRSVDMHLQSTKHTGERVVAGKKEGLFELGDEVTWRARHFGVWQNLTVRITEMQPYSFFADEMVKGAFHSFHHEHRFTVMDSNSTLMEDVFVFRAPFGLLGKLVDKLILHRYMTTFLEKRNQSIKAYAESRSAE